MAVLALIGFALTIQVVMLLTGASFFVAVGILSALVLVAALLQPDHDSPYH